MEINSWEFKSHLRPICNMKNVILTIFFNFKHFTKLCVCVFLIKAVRFLCNTLATFNQQTSFVNVKYFNRNEIFEIFDGS